jgi:predicted transposase YdaD
MRYITSVERIGIQKGIKKGIHQTIRKLLLNGLAPDEIVKLLDIDMQTVLTITQPSETEH